MPDAPEHTVSSWLERWLRRIEDAVYIAIALLLILVAGTLLVGGVREFVNNLGTDDMAQQAIRMLDKLLLVLMIVELLYTVRVSLRTHGLLPEPFLIVGMIAAMRRVLVITAEAWQLGEVNTAQFNRAMVELGLLTVLILVLVFSIILLHRYRTKNADPIAEAPSQRDT